jgi:hypothetical protein
MGPFPHIVWGVILPSGRKHQTHPKVAERV